MSKRVHAVKIIDSDTNLFLDKITYGGSPFSKRGKIFRTRNFAISYLKKGLAMLGEKRRDVELQRFSKCEIVDIIEADKHSLLFYLNELN
jgi:hypothetical protein